MQLTPHFSLAELTFSATAQIHKIDNSPGPAQLEALKYLAAKMELVREILDSRPILVTSGFRSHALNKRIGGVNSSQHSKGQAVDFHCAGFGSPRRVCQEIMKHKEILEYDQLILEPTWVHISFVAIAPRLNELTFVSKGNYIKSIV